MTKILITGVAGFIGSNFAYHLAKTYPAYTLIGIDNLSDYSCRANIQPLEEKGAITFVQADICDYAQMEELYQHYQFDYVVNFAAESHNDRGIVNPLLFGHTNMIGAQNLLELSRHYTPKKHVQISTIEVYGEQGEDIPFFTEDSPLNAKTPYSAAKAAGDMMTRAYIRTYSDMNIAITHCANNYGPYQFPEKLIPLSVTNVLRGKKIPLYGDGLQRRDWLHVTDHCRGVDLVMHGKTASGGPLKEVDPDALPIFDFSAREERTNREIAEYIATALGKKFDDVVEFVADRVNHDRRYLINPDKVEQELEFKPEVDFEKGIEATVKWYVDHQDWWEAILRRTQNLQFDWASVNP